MDVRDSIDFHVYDFQERVVWLQFALWGLNIKL